MAVKLSLNSDILRLDQPVMELVILEEGYQVKFSYVMVKTFLLNQGQISLETETPLDRIWLPPYNNSAY